MVTEYLLENGAKPNRANQLGVTLLIAAARRGKKDVVKCSYSMEQTSTLSVVTPRTALQEAIEGNHTEIITMLVKATAEVSVCLKGSVVREARRPGQSVCALGKCAH